MSTHKADVLSVEQIMLTKDQFPVVNERKLFKEALEKMNDAGLGIACVIDGKGILTGVLTDGDIRRKLLKIQKPISAIFIDDVSTHAVKSPVTVQVDEDLRSMVKTMGVKKIWDLPVVDRDNRLLGLLHLHPLVEVLLNSE